MLKKFLPLLLIVFVFIQRGASQTSILPPNTIIKATDLLKVSFSPGTYQKKNYFIEIEIYDSGKLMATGTTNNFSIIDNQPEVVFFTQLSFKDNRFIEFVNNEGDLPKGNYEVHYKMISLKPKEIAGLMTVIYSRGKLSVATNPSKESVMKEKADSQSKDTLVVESHQEKNPVIKIKEKSDTSVHTPAIVKRGEIKGIVRDTTSYPRVVNAIAALIGASDSVLQAFTRTRKDGSFTLPNIPFANYILIITHPNFGDYAEEISLTDSSKSISKDFFLVQKSILINEVIIQRQRDIRINGDTTEFNAKNYKLLENATAEDLLKLLPGIKVDKDGKITAYGETVNKVYVDGEEFFGDDPTMATKNIRAEMIDKVQVIDKPSDQAKITGVDDGNKTKVINLKLKDEFKQGFFGKVHASAGIPNTLDNSFMLNSFKEKRKFTAYITQSNIGNNRLNWSDRQNYGAASTTVYEEGFSYSYYDGDDNILGGNEGISNTINGGTNFNNKYLKNKLNLNSSYSFNSGNRNIIKSTNIRQTINDSTYFQNQDQNYNATLISHAPVLRLSYEIDSNNSLSYNLTANIKDTKLKGDYYNETLNAKSEKVNTSLRSLDQDEKSNSFNQSLLVAHKFKHKGRTLSLSTGIDLGNNFRIKYIDTRQQYFNEGNLFRVDTLNQKNDRELYNQVITSKLSYTEPLSKKWILEIHYKPTLATNKSKVISTVKDLGGEYTNMVDTLSNNFVFKTNKQEAGASIRFNYKKTGITLGLNDETGELQRQDLISSKNYNYRYNSLNPSLQLRCTLKNNFNLSVRYSGMNNQPQISQLQPVKDYSNPLSINIGNPDLKPEYKHNFNAFIHRYWLLHSRSFYANISYNLTENAFTQKSTFSSEGITKYNTINGGQTSNAYAYMGYDRKIIKDLVELSFSYNISSYSSNSIINEIINYSTSTNHRLGWGMDYVIEKVFKVGFDYKFTYATNMNKGTAVTNTNIIGHELELEFSVDFLKHYYIRSDYFLMKNKSNTPSARPYESQLLNASAGYKFLKNKAELGFIAHNILNQNNGYSLTQNATMITRTQSNVLGRYFMLSFTYNFANKSSIKKEEDDDD